MTRKPVFLYALCDLCVERFLRFNTESTERGHKGHRDADEAKTERIAGLILTGQGRIFWIYQRVRR